MKSGACHAPPECECMRSSQPPRPGSTARHTAESPPVAHRLRNITPARQPNPSNLASRSGRSLRAVYLCANDNLEAHQESPTRKSLLTRGTRRLSRCRGCRDAQPFSQPCDSNSTRKGQQAARPRAIEPESSLSLSAFWSSLTPEANLACACKRQSRAGEHVIVYY